jgi:Fe-S-cluster containining protein
MTTFWLSTHLGYACRHTGVCCSSRWPIPIERDRAARVRGALASGALAIPTIDWLERDPRAPEEMAGVLALQASGTCVFHQRHARTDPAPGGCSIHAMRPASCEHFPYVCVTDPRGVHVTLSHYCPTAADLLFTDTTPVAVVAGPPVLGDGRLPEGLDAREALPPEAAASSRAPVPALGAWPRDGRRPSPRLMDWDEVTRWEQAFISALAEDRRTPEPPDQRLFKAAVAAVPPALSWPAAIDDTLRVWHERVAPVWSRWAAVVGRYLAARAHASWAMCLGRGPADVEHAVAVARVVLQIEVIRECADPGAYPDDARLKAAIRRADLLLVHYAEPGQWWRSVHADPSLPPTRG